MTSYKLKSDEYFYIRSMNRSIRVTYVTTSETDANGYMTRHNNQGVIAEFGPFIFIADIYDLGLKDEPITLHPIPQDVLSDLDDAIATCDRIAAELK